MNKVLIAVCAGAVLASCGGNTVKNEPGARKLPLLGEPMITSREVNGAYVADTIYPTIPHFAFVDQEGDTISSETFSHKIYVADFFFTTCPTICPVMKKEMLRVYDAYHDNPDVLLLSHTIDPGHDSVPVLKEYAGRLEVTADKWHFVTGNRDSIFSIAEYYMVSAEEDPSAPGGFIHSGALVLIDSDKHIRGYYDGTKPQDVDQLIEDIPVLLNEKK